MKISKKKKRDEKCENNNSIFKINVVIATFFPLTILFRTGVSYGRPVINYGIWMDNIIWLSKLRWPPLHVFINYSCNIFSNLITIIIITQTCEVFIIFNIYVNSNNLNFFWFHNWFLRIRMGPLYFTISSSKYNSQLTLKAKLRHLQIQN